MAERTITERLQPSLLDRLTDEAPGEGHERREDRVIDIRRLREIVLRDLSWLLNTSNAGGEVDARRMPLAARSVLNYGIREVAGDYSTQERTELIRRSIVEGISAFEPRIAPGSIDVRVAQGEEARRSTVTFDIRADMWAQPMPLELYLRSEVDLATGELDIERVG